MYGVGAMVGNTWGGRAADRFGTVSTLFAVLAGIGVTVAVLSLTAGTVVGAAVVLALWGVFCWAFNPPVQSLLLELASTSGLVLSLNASAIYLGTALAGVVGGTVIVLLLAQQLGRRRAVAETERVPACAGLATAE